MATIRVTTIFFEDQKWSLQDFVKKHFSANWLREVQAVVESWLSGKREWSLQTSGSTGIPKQIVLSRDVLLHSAQTTLRYINVDGGKALLCLPAKYIGGKMMIIRALVSGMELHLVEPRTFLSQLSHTYDLVALTPLQAQNALNQLDAFRIVLLGGADVSIALQSALQNTSAAVYHTYGMTETASHIALRRLNGAEKSTFFTALPGVKLQTDERQCLVIDAPKWKCNHLITNDVVTLHGENRFLWLGRVDNVVNSGGVKLFPEEIEAKLAQNISEPFFVAGIPDEKFGQRLVLFVESSQVREIDFSHLPKLMQPKQVIAINKFSYTKTHKIDRHSTVKSVEIPR